MVNNIFTIEKTRPQTFTYIFNGNHHKKATGLLACMKHFCHKETTARLKKTKNKTKKLNRTKRTATEKEFNKINLRST